MNCMIETGRKPVVDTYIVQGDVDFRSGNIRSYGDVYVSGNVQDGMEIESLGNVFVAGHVYRSTIIAAGNVRIQGQVQGSELYSGYYGKTLISLYGKLHKLARQLQSLRAAAGILTDRVRSQGKAVRIGHVLLLLAENKFTELMPLANAIVRKLSELEEWDRKIAAGIEEALLPFSRAAYILEIGSMEGLQTTAKSIADYLRFVEETQKSDTLMELGHCHLSRLYCCGDVKICREGAVLSTISAKRNILFCDKTAVCCGSELFAGDTIEAETVGSENGGESRLHAGKRILLGEMFGGRLAVERFREEVRRPLRDVMVTNEGILSLKT